MVWMNVMPLCNVIQPGLQAGGLERRPAACCCLVQKRDVLSYLILRCPVPHMIQREDDIPLLIPLVCNVPHLVNAQATAVNKIKLQTTLRYSKG